MTSVDSSRIHFSELPVLGVGLAADVASVLPNFRNFLGDQPDTIDYLSVGAHHVQLTRLRYYIDDLVQLGLPIVFHPINFNIALEDAEDEAVLEGARQIADYLHAVWAGQDVGLWTYDQQYLGSFLVPAVLDMDSAIAVSKKVASLNARMPCPMLVENPPVNFSLGNMHMLDFIAYVSERADCGIVLDIGHLIGYQQATGRSPTDMPLDCFPLDRVVEVHMAGLQFSQIGPDMNIIDQHAYPVHELCWEFLSEHVSRMTGLKGITLEQEFCEDYLVLEHLRKARRLTCELGVFRGEN